MKVLLLDAVTAADVLPAADSMAGIIDEEYRRAGWEVEVLRPRGLDIAPCRGCFQCWVRTPGVCSIADDGRRVARAWVQSDVVALLTPVTFGGYSPALKRAIDRTIPILSPFFMKIKGEVHHRPRYERYPAIVGIGVADRRDDEAAALFSRIIERHATNAHSPWHRAFVLAGEQEWRGVGHLIGPLAARAEEAA